MQTGRLDELLAAGAEVELRLGGVTPDVLAEMARFGSCESLDGERLAVRLASEDQVPDLVAWLAGRGVRVYSVVPRHQSLEDFFLRVMEGEEAG